MISRLHENQSNLRKPLFKILTNRKREIIFCKDELTTDEAKLTYTATSRHDQIYIFLILIYEVLPEEFREESFQFIVDSFLAYSITV